jgi:hypothetical protein
MGFVMALASSSRKPSTSVDEKALGRIAKPSNSNCSDSFGGIIKAFSTLAGFEKDNPI